MAAKKAKKASKTKATKAKTKAPAKKAPAKKMVAKKKVVKKAAQKKVAKTVAKTASKKAVPPPPVEKAVATPPEAPRTPTTITGEERQKMIAEAAYYRSMQRGPQAAPGRDWAEAEAAIDAMLDEHGVEAGE